MDEIADSGSGSKQRSLSVSPKDKGSKNKRKSADPSMGNPLNIPPSLTEFPRYELSPDPEVSQRSLSELTLELGLDRPKEGPEPEAFGATDWDDPIACQLEEILFSNLQVVFRCAIKQIVELGYSEEVAEKVVSRGGLYLEGKDPVVNIVNDTLYFMEEGKDIHDLRDDMFDDLQHLVEYTMLEIIGVLREVRPFLSIGEAMWWLLICDLNVSQACALERDPLSGFGCKNVSGEGSSDSAIPQFRSEAQSSETILPNPKEPKFPKLSLPKAKKSLPKTLKFESFPNLPKPEDLALEGVTPEEESLVSLTCTLRNSSGITRENVQIVSQTYASEEKVGAGRKGRTKKELAVLRQKCFHMDKSYRTYGSKGGFRSGKLASFGGFVLERRLKPPSELPGVQMKNASSKKSTEVPADVPLADGSHPVNKSPSAVPAKEKTSKLRIKGTMSMLPTAETKLPISSPSEKKSNSEPQVSTSEAPKIPDYYTGIPYENSLGKYVAQNEKDELILKLVPRLQELQDELQGWTEWANQKVMHAAHRLGKDQRELKALRLENEDADQYKKEKQILEENTMKRLSEMENALSSATGQVEILNSTVLKLEAGKLVLKRELDAAKLRALESAASYQEVVEREQMTLKKAQSCEGQKALLQEEYEREKCKVAELQQELDKAKNLHNQIEARWKLDRMTPEKLLTQAASIRQERELLEAHAKAEEEVIRQKAEGDLQKYMEDIKKLENKLSQMKFKSNSSTIAALRSGIGRSCGNVLTDSMDVQAMQRNQEPLVLKRVANLQNSFRTRGLKQERECAMCLSEEMSVVFLPCAHQVVCAKCNELHEKQGMKDCPSCMTPIQWRINVRFARPSCFTPISRIGEC